MKRVLIPLLALALLLAGVCAQAEGDTLKFDKTLNTVFEGETLQTVLTRAGGPAEGELSYTSSNQKVAVVDAQGIVTGVKKGEAVITATVRTDKKTWRAQLQVTVARKAESVTVNTAKLPVFAADDPLLSGLLDTNADPSAAALPVLVIPAKKTYELQITTMPQDATSRKLVISAADPAILKVRDKTITGGAAGETVLTVANALSPEINAQYRVLVVNPVSRIQLSFPARTIAVGSTMPLSAAYSPETATLQAVVWSTSDERIATVDENGAVTGIKRGEVRLTAVSRDGSGVRASIELKVTQSPTDITLNKPELTVDAGRTAVLAATVLPQNADNKGVVWASSDESVATVNQEGRVKGIALGTCEIICTSKVAPEVQATATVHVQQPVTKVVLDAAPAIYVGETGILTWHVEPENASNKTLKFTSSNTRILTVDERGVVTAVKAGEAYVTATTTDGSERKARVKVNIYQHVTGVHMLRETAYICPGETATAGAVLEPSNATNNHMTWVSVDPYIAAVSGDTHRARITGQANGQTVIYGTTEDGGFTTSIVVKVGDYDHSLRLTSADLSGREDFLVQARNVSDLYITQITVEIEAYDLQGNPMPINIKDGGNKIKGYYKRGLNPDARTRDDGWSYPDYDKPQNDIIGSYTVRIISYQIDRDWVKTIRTRNRPTRTYVSPY